MPSQSERTFGNRLANANKIFQSLLTFTAYAPPSADLSAPSLKAKIDDISAANETAANSLQSWQLKVNTRRELFYGEPNSLKRIVQKVVAAVRATTGKNSQPAKAVAAYAAKMRSIPKPKKEADPGANPPPNPTPENTVSQSELSYGSITQSFKDMVEVLASLGATYAPATPEIQLTALQTLATNIDTVNGEVAGTSTARRLAVGSRVTLYGELSQLCQRVKDAVKSQYGTTSKEYTVIKGLKI